MNATLTTAIRTIALVIIVLIAATAGLVVGQLMQGGDATETAAAAAGGPPNTFRYWDLVAPQEERSRPQPGQRKAGPSTEADVDPDAAVKRGLTLR